jgi:hypothetical protein
VVFAVFGSWSPGSPGGRRTHPQRKNLTPAKRRSTYRLGFTKGCSAHLCTVSKSRSCLHWQAYGCPAVRACPFELGGRASHSEFTVSVTSQVPPDPRLHVDSRDDGTMNDDRNENGGASLAGIVNAAPCQVI